MNFSRNLAKFTVFLFALPVFAVPAAISFPSEVSAASCWEEGKDISECFWGHASGIPKPQGAVSIGDGTIENGAKGKIVAIANRVITLAAVVAIAGIVFAGFHMVSAFGDDEKLKQGKEALKWSVLGFALALLSFPLVNATVNFFYSTGR